MIFALCKELVSGGNFHAIMIPWTDLITLSDVLDSVQQRACKVINGNRRKGDVTRIPVCPNPGVAALCLCSNLLWQEISKPDSACLLVSERLGCAAMHSMEDENAGSERSQLMSSREHRQLGLDVLACYSCCLVVVHQIQAWFVLSSVGRVRSLIKSLSLAIFQTEVGRSHHARNRSLSRR
jgi:hypothetical protein